MLPASINGKMNVLAWPATLESGHLVLATTSDTAASNWNSPSITNSGFNLRASITASSIFSWRPPERVIIYDQDTSNPWVSKNIVGSWLEINFKEEKVKINGYSLKSPQWGPHSDTLQNWVIDGSKDGKNWIEIDKRENDNYLNGPGYEHYYPISKTIDEFQYIRIRNTGQCHCGCSAYLALINFEVYGDITISNQKIDSK